MKKILTLTLFFLFIFLTKTAFCQDIIDTPITNFVKQPDVIQPRVYKIFLTKGRILGINLNALKGATITNTRTAEKTSTDNNGIYQLSAAKGDTITFEFQKLSRETRIIKYPENALNVILIKRKADELPANTSKSDMKKAEKADDELYSILEKDAKLEGKWIY